MGEASMLGNRVRAYRQRMGLSQQDLAQLAGVDPKTIRSVEAGRTTPRISTVRQLADAFGLDGTERERFCTSVDADTGDVVVPAQLPADPPSFVGRCRELDRLDRLVLAADGSARVATVSGAAGVGKTAFAVHWAHRVAGQFPDGQLSLNLRGFDVVGRAMCAGEAIRTLLDALAVPAGRIPVDLDAQVGLLRSVVAGRRLLILLDNARDAEQVRPLLPGTPDALVVVTSRDQLSPLVAVDGAYPLHLEPLSTVEARGMLAGRLGADQVDAEPDAVDVIIEACARLPLALAIAAARVQQSGFPVTAVAAELRDGSRRLDALDAGDQYSQIRAVLARSYTALSAPAARLFRLLGLHAGTDIAGPAVASLAGHPPSQARALLAELVRLNLLSEYAPGRYALHDLLAVYARDLARRHDDETTCAAATNRLLAHYTHTAHAADLLLHPLRDPIDLGLDRMPRHVVVERLADDGQAMRWLNAERHNLLAAIAHAAYSRRDAAAWRLAWTLDTFLTRRGYRHDLAKSWQAALSAAHRLGNPTAEAYASRALAVANIQMERYDEAQPHAQHALEVYSRIRNDVGQGYANRNLAFLCWQQGDARQALQYAERGLALFRAAGHQRGIANELNGVGWYHAELGNHADALAYCEQALDLLQQLGDEVGIAYTWDSLGFVHHHLGHHREAIDCYERALVLSRRLGDRRDEADTLTRLGDTYELTGDRDAARRAWVRALDILTDLGLPDAALVSAKLARLDPYPVGRAELA
jgi:tetratricopeptide (TPR) repeat protein/transcriptional regulator with XRE-family HTH domain